MFQGYYRAFQVQILVLNLVLHAKICAYLQQLAYNLCEALRDLGGQLLAVVGPVS